MRREPPTAEIMTVAWMLAVMTALLCEIAFVVARLYLLAVAEPFPPIKVLAAMLFFAALVIGLISLAFGFAVLKANRVQPPRGILVFSVVVGAAPIVTGVLLLLVSLVTRPAL